MAQANNIKNQSVVALMAEVTEGTPVDPSGTGSYIQVLSDGVESGYEREELERSFLSSSLEKSSSRAGQKTITASLPTELRASATEGAYPETELLFESAIGGKRTAASANTTTSNTSTVLNFSSHPFLAGDCVVIQESGAYECRPVASVTSTTVTLAFALDNGAPSDGVTVAAVSTFYHNDLNATASMTLTNYLGNEIKEQLAGMKVSSLSVDGWETGSLPNANFSLVGLGMTHADGAAPHTPVYESSEPPVALSACLWLNGTKLHYNALSLSVENEISAVPSACDADGKLANRYVGQNVTLTCNPYMDDTTTTWFDAFDDNSDVSAFAYAYNPSSTAGEFDEVVAFWLPQTRAISRANEDVSGVYADGLTLKAHKSSGNDSVFISFI